MSKRAGLPVILLREEYDVWLGGEFEAATALAKPYPGEAMEIVEG